MRKIRHLADSLLGSKPTLTLTLALALAACSARDPAALGDLGSDAEAHRIRPGDVVRLAIWREEDLSGDFRVDADGRVVLPKVGSYAAAGMRADSFRTRVAEDLRVYLANPSIEVSVLRNVRIMGAVRKPALYPLDPTMTLGDALALAGGADETGRTDRIELVRDGRRIRAELDPATRVMDLPLRTGDALVVPRQSWILRNSSVVAGVASTVAGVVLGVMLR